MPGPAAVLCSRPRSGHGGRVGSGYARAMHGFAGGQGVPAAQLRQMGHRAP